MSACPRTPCQPISICPADKRREFLRVRRNAAGGLDLFANQSSGVLTSAVWGDGVVDHQLAEPLRMAIWCAMCRLPTCCPDRSSAISATRHPSYQSPSSEPCKSLSRYFASIREALGTGSETMQTQAATWVRCAMNCWHAAVRMPGTGPPPCRAHRAQPGHGR